jgi:hypothetical protein
MFNPNDISTFLQEAAGNGSLLSNFDGEEADVSLDTDFNNEEEGLEAQEPSNGIPMLAESCMGYKAGAMEDINSGMEEEVEFDLKREEDKAKSQHRMAKSWELADILKPSLTERYAPYEPGPWRKDISFYDEGSGEDVDIRLGYDGMLDTVELCPEMWDGEYSSHLGAQTGIALMEKDLDWVLRHDSIEAHKDLREMRVEMLVQSISRSTVEQATRIFTKVKEHLKSSREKASAYSLWWMVYLTKEQLSRIEAAAVAKGVDVLAGSLKGMRIKRVQEWLAYIEKVNNPVTLSKALEVINERYRNSCSECAKTGKWYEIHLSKAQVMEVRNAFKTKIALIKKEG